MYTHVLQVPSMHCNGCIKTISRALTALDAQAQIETDLERHQLRVTTAQAREAVVEAILDAGHEVAAS